jgi:hypothetical protein
MTSHKNLLGLAVVLACLPGTFLLVPTGMMKIAHGNVLGARNKSFLLLFIPIFLLVFIPAALKSKLQRETSLKRRMRAEALHLVLGAALGYVASLLAFVIVVFVFRGSSNALADRTDPLYLASALLFNNRGWLFGAISFAAFDLMRRVVGKKGDRRN